MRPGDWADRPSATYPPGSDVAVWGGERHCLLIGAGPRYLGERAHIMNRELSEIEDGPARVHSVETPWWP
jgi:hypothetical protein